LLWSAFDRVELRPYLDRENDTKQHVLPFVDRRHRSCLMNFNSRILRRSTPASTSASGPTYPITLASTHLPAPDTQKQVGTASASGRYPSFASGEGKRTLDLYTVRVRCCHRFGAIPGEPTRDPAPVSAPVLILVVCSMPRRMARRQRNKRSCIKRHAVGPMYMRTPGPRCGPGVGFEALRHLR
jgi:hypothetical protein